MDVNNVDGKGTIILDLIHCIVLDHVTLTLGSTPPTLKVQFLVRFTMLTIYQLLMSSNVGGLRVGLKKPLNKISRLGREKSDSNHNFLAKTTKHNIQEMHSIT